MAEPILDNNDDIKKRATRRLLVAVTLVLLAVGILTWLSQYKPAKPVATSPTAPTFAPPVVISEPPPIIAAPSNQPPQLEPVPEVPVASPSPPAPTPTPVVSTPPPPPKVVSKPLPPPGPGPKPDAAPAPTPLVKADVPATPKPAAATTTSAVPVQAPAPPKSYLVQVGVFSNHENAVQLQQRLTAAGIASSLETRVHLGPFKDKTEADQALAKLKAMGINAVLMPR